jgi:hypothetical protein
MRIEMRDAHARPLLAGRQHAVIRHEAVSGDVSFWRRRRAARALAGAVPRRSRHDPGKTRKGWCRWPLAGGGRPGRARDCGRPALPAVVPAAVGTPAVRILPSQACKRSLRPPGSRPAPPPAGRREPAAARRPWPSTGTSRLPQPPFPGFPGSCRLRRGTAPARARAARLPRPARRAATSPSTPALTPAVPETGQARARPMAEQTRGSEIQGWLQFCVVIFGGGGRSGCGLRAGLRRRHAPRPGSRLTGKFRLSGK